MSYQDFQKAMELAPKCEYYYSRGGTTAETIQKAEALLGLQFSGQCREFYEKYNYISFSGNEIEGINPDSNFPLAGNAVATALAARKESGLPEQWVPVLEEGFDGLVVYMDYSQLNAEGEPRIIEAVYTNGDHLVDDDAEDFDEDEECCRYKVTEVLAEDLGEYILSVVEEALEELEDDEVSAEAENMESNSEGGRKRTTEEIMADLLKLREEIRATSREVDALSERISKRPWITSLFKKKD